MRCDDFLRRCREGIREVADLEHLRSCASCLEASLAVDPDNLFRSLGGDELVPTGGVDAFVSGVMGQLHLRSTEKRMDRTRSSRASWAIAAAVTLAIVGAALFPWPQDATRPIDSQMRLASNPMAAETLPTAETLPVIEHYDSADAMIVEFPSDQNDNLKIVMIFDENLPVDL